MKNDDPQKRVLLEKAAADGQGIAAAVDDLGGIYERGQGGSQRIFRNTALRVAMRAELPLRREPRTQCSTARNGICLEALQSFLSNQLKAACSNSPVPNGYRHWPHGRFSFNSAITSLISVLFVMASISGSMAIASLWCAQCARSICNIFVFSSSDKRLIWRSRWFLWSA